MGAGVLPSRRGGIEMRGTLREMQEEGRQPPASFNDATPPRTHSLPPGDGRCKKPIWRPQHPPCRLLAKRAGAMRYFGGPCHPCLRNAAAWPRNRYWPTSIPPARQDCWQRGCERTRGKWEEGRGWCPESSPSGRLAAVLPALPPNPT